ncbi:hypothetical protein SDC9_141683 [bioreactor metagenome]|uniref:Ig-like domain-containing protein n=1 Tax=bioreactor metagenome TaxID=1076179 RepID=A0A645DYT2_9ZZZZ
MLIKVAPEIQIKSQPIGLNKCEGNNAEFSVVATPTEPTEPIAYQWYRNDVALVNDAVFSGVASDKLTVTGIRSIDAGSYKVAIKYTKLDAGIYSDVAVLNVETAPVISKVTQDTTVEEGNTLILSVEVADQPNAIYEYQWYKDNIELPQSNESVYLVSTATKDDEGVYKVIVKSLNGCGDVTSSVINVKIATGIFDNNTDPNFKILSVLPNPVSLEATVNFMLPDNQFARLYLTDMHGRNVSLFEGVCASGLNSVKISDTLKNFSNGTYFIILESKGRKVAYSITINK